MQIKLLHLNIQSGRYLEQVIQYITTEDIDILQFQEVSGGEFNKFGHHDLFETIKQRLNYVGVLTKTMTKTNDEMSYFGNGTFVKNNIPILESNVIWLKPFEQINELPKEHFENLPRNALHVKVNVAGKMLNIVNTHLSWGPRPDDKRYKIEQGEILYHFMQSLPPPFILTGDFNVTKRSQIVRWIDSVGRNITSENHVTNTLNPRTHRVREIFPAGLAVDFIFTSKEIIVQNFEQREDIDLSDHFGQIITFEL